MSDFKIEKGVLIEYTGEGGDVIIPDEVIQIGGYAFYDCKTMTSL